MLSGTSTDSRKLSCSRATALEKTLSQSLCQKAYFPAYDSNSYTCMNIGGNIFIIWTQRETIISGTFLQIDIHWGLFIVSSNDGNSYYVSNNTVSSY